MLNDPIKLKDPDDCCNAHQSDLRPPSEPDKDFDPDETAFDKEVSDENADYKDLGDTLDRQVKDKKR